MDPDVDIARWVLEFLFRKVIDDKSISQLLSVIPLPENDSRLKKTMLLRTIESDIVEGTVSEKILNLLETVAELDAKDGSMISETMKVAYCAVAVDCTVRFMEDNGNGGGKYLEVVKRIWRERIVNLEKSHAVNLISDQLRNWGEEIEAAIWDSTVSGKILARNTRHEGLVAVRVYVSEAWKVMGPTFLELAAKRIGKSLVKGTTLGRQRRFERPAILPNVPRNMGISNESNAREEDKSGKRAFSLPNAQQDIGVSNESTAEDESQVGERVTMSSGDVGGDSNMAATNIIQVENRPIPLHSTGVDLGVRRSQKGTSSQDMGYSLNLSMADKTEVEKIAIPFNGGNLAEGPSKKNKYQGEERAPISCDASGSTEPTVTSRDQERVAATPPSVPAVRDEEAQKGKKLPAHKHVASHGERSRAKIAETEESGVEISSKKDDCLSTAEVNEVQNALVQSPLESQAVLKDQVEARVPIEPMVRSKDQERVTTTSSAPAARNKEAQKGKPPLKRKHVAAHGKHSRGVKIAQTEELHIDIASKKNACLSTPEVNKVQEALRHSSLELQAVVKDPLPDALRLAEAVISDMRRQNTHHEHVETQSRMDIDAPNGSFAKSVEVIQGNGNDAENLCSKHQKNDVRPTSVEQNHDRKDENALKHSDNNSAGAVQENKDNHANQGSTHQNNEPGPSLMERNLTAHTFEWDDSIDDDSSEGSDQRLHLATPSRKVVSPLKTYQQKKFARRRTIKKWSKDEEETLIAGVRKFGRGNWKLILNSYRNIFEERTEVDLKDKWRNMTRSGGAS